MPRARERPAIAFTPAGLSRAWSAASRPGCEVERRPRAPRWPAPCGPRPAVGARVDAGDVAARRHGRAASPLRAHPRDSRARRVRPDERSPAAPARRRRPSAGRGSRIAKRSSVRSQWSSTCRCIAHDVVRVDPRLAGRRADDVRRADQVERPRARSSGSSAGRRAPSSGGVAGVERDDVADARRRSRRSRRTAAARKPSAHRRRRAASKSAAPRAPPAARAARPRRSRGTRARPRGSARLEAAARPEVDAGARRRHARLRGSW